MHIVGRLALAGLLVTLGAAFGCGGGDETASGMGGKDAGGDATTGGTSGTAGAGGAGGSGGSGGSGGNAAAGGSAATGGSAGAGGSGVGGSAGAGGSGVGGAGAGGSAGAAGAGVGGSGGTAAGGSGGSAAGGAAGSGGSGGGAAGSGGAAGGAGADAGAPECITDADCDNQVHCDGVEQCVSGVCVAGASVVCQQDQYTCTTAVCDETSKACKTVFSDTTCSDNNFCNGIEQCNPSATGANPATGCVAGTPPLCDDEVTCTVDSCDPVQGKCVFTPTNAACSDNVFCNGDEVCDPATGDPQTGCRAGPPVDCEDGIGCTADSCNEAEKKCDHAPNHAACTDGVFCNGVEQCSLTQGCVPGTAVSCPNTDGITCTVEACDEQLQSCTSTPTSSLCPSGQICLAANGCVVQACQTNADCSDNNACNGVETCVESGGNKTCQPGTPVNCNDGIACTVDSCEPSTGQCTNTPFSGFCGDGNACNGIETCQAGVGCVGGTPLSCDDGIACTADTCIPSLGCMQTPVDSACSDGLICNGEEVCHATLGCQPSTGPLQCPPDGIPCTSESCVEGVGCVSAPDSSQCPCGETCSPTQGGCGNFCTIGTCQGKVYQCGDCLDNDGDCRIDSADEHCVGPCDNNEQGFHGSIAGQNNAPCKMDCYFDQDTGAGNDDCYWSHKCDPLSVAPNYPPSGTSQCSYSANANIPGYQGSCATAFATQSQQCLSYCGPLTPNGCDCFGCCAIPGVGYTVYLGSEHPSKTPSCNLANLGDPLKCKPCTQVQACINTCENCELCLGKPTLPPECTEQTCPAGLQKCGLPGQASCPAGTYCVTGCCQPVPQ